MVDHSSTPSARPPRPSFNGSVRSKSFLEEHQQYRPPQQDGHQGIDSIVEGLQISNSPPPPPPPVAAARSSPKYNGVPSSSSPPRVTHSGLDHTLSHSNCQPADGTRSNRLVATLFYKSNTPRISNNLPQPDRAPSPSTAIPDNFAPTTSLSAFPLEPPPPDPEPLDHLYGSYISQLCLTSFLTLIASLPLPQGSETLISSHRCLDTPYHPRVVELNFSPAPDPEYLTLDDLRKHELLYRFEREWNVDVVLQVDTPLRRYPRLVVFDMDSTLIEQEVIDLIAASIGVEAEVSAITARAMNGELDFSASLRERVRLLKGVDAQIFTKLRQVITPTKGVRELVRALKRLGVKTAVLSGGFIPLTSWLASNVGIDYAYANTLASAPSPAGDMLTGELGDTPIINAEKKASLLLEIAAKEGISTDQVIAVGDGANDLLMMKEAALGVAFRAKPVVQMQASARINGESLLDLLYLFGFTFEEVSILSS
ncbi:MAG: hypothetical protein M1818_001557 [Claussenomyces sp. TS43310]|nr:MAG: hypothetical protein M1818_001557 [Claussenomyces sp. TS43310]